MRRRFQRGLVVGKFSPLHRGHEFVINRAAEECAEVVLLSYSKPEFPGCDAGRREEWLSALFPETRRLVVTDERLKHWAGPGKEPREVPHNDSSDLTHRRFCGFLCTQVLGVTVDAAFTSEDYGEGFARELTRYFRQHAPGSPPVRHILVDRDRIEFPVSGTLLRQDIHAHRDSLSPVVYASFVERVSLLGGECSGKSTLAEILAREFGTSFTSEYGRDLWEEKSGALVFEDMQRIAEAQIRREDAAALRATRFLFCDTSPLTTLFYSRHLFSRAAPVLETLAGRAYHHTLLCAPDFPFVQDGTRQAQAFRARQHEWYRNELNRRQIPFQVVTGSIEDRVRQVRNSLTSAARIPPEFP